MIKFIKIFVTKTKKVLVYRICNQLYKALKINTMKFFLIHKLKSIIILMFKTKVSFRIFIIISLIILNLYF